MYVYKIRYLTESRDQVFVKGYDFLLFTKTMVKNTGKDRSKNLSVKYSHKLVNHAKQAATDELNVYVYENKVLKNHKFIRKNNTLTI